MLAYIGISCIAVTILIGGIRWTVTRAGYGFPRRFWLYCLAAVLAVCLLLPRLVVGTFGVGGSLLLSLAFLCALAWWLAAAFSPSSDLAKAIDGSADDLLVAPDEAELAFEMGSAAGMLPPEPVESTETCPPPTLAVTEPADATADVQLPFEAQLAVAVAQAACFELPDELPAAAEPLVQEAPLPPPVDTTAAVAAERDALLTTMARVIAIMTARQSEPAVLSCPLAAETPASGACEAALPASDSLDDLLDYALSQRAAKQFDQAQAAMQAAILLYGEKDVDSLPYLISELAAIHKAQGHYKQAIAAFEEGLALLPNEGFGVWRSQFLSSVAHLRLTIEVLTQHHHEMTAFEQLPQALQAEIETAYFAWSQSNHVAD